MERYLSTIWQTEIAKRQERPQLQNQEQLLKKRRDPNNPSILHKNHPTGSIRPSRAIQAELFIHRRPEGSGKDQERHGSNDREERSAASTTEADRPRLDEQEELVDPGIQSTEERREDEAEIGVWEMDECHWYASIVSRWSQRSNAGSCEYHQIRHEN